MPGLPARVRAAPRRVPHKACGFFKPNPRSACESRGRPVPRANHIQSAGKITPPAIDNRSKLGRHHLKSAGGKVGPPFPRARPDSIPNTPPVVAGCSTPTPRTVAAAAARWPIQGRRIAGVLPATRNTPCGKRRLWSNVQQDRHGRSKIRSDPHCSAPRSHVVIPAEADVVRTADRTRDHIM